MGGSKIGEKPEKKILNPQEKLAAITRVNERGESKASVARDLGIPESTLRGWCKNSLRINYQSSRSSPDTDDALTLKLSPTTNGSGNKRKSLLSSTSSCKKRGRRPNSPNTTTNQLLMTGSTLTELNRLKSEYGLSRTSDYLTQSSSIDTNTNSLDAAMRGWALQMQMLLQASMAASTSDISTNNHTIINPLTTQNNISSSSLLTTTNATSIMNQLWAPLTDSTTNNTLYTSGLNTASTSSTLPLNLNFPTTSTNSLSQMSNSLLMSYLPNSLLDGNLNQTSTTNIPTTKSPIYQTPKYPWRANSPSGYMQNFGSSTSSSASMSPKSRGSNSQGFNELYYGTDEEAPVLTNLSPSNEETSSDSMLIPKTVQAPMDFSNHPHTSQSTSLVDEISKGEFPQVDESHLHQGEIQENQIQENQIQEIQMQENQIQEIQLQENQIQENQIQEIQMQEIQMQEIQMQEIKNETEEIKNLSQEVIKNITHEEMKNIIQEEKNITQEIKNLTQEVKNEVQFQEIKSDSSENSNKSSIEELPHKFDKNQPSSTSTFSKMECSEGHRKNLESVLASVFQVTNNNTIVSLDGEQKAISITEAIECGEVFLKFLETAKDPNVTASQITQFKHILSSIKAGSSQKNNERKPKVSRK